MEQIISFFLKNQAQIADSFNNIKVSNEKTSIRFGAKADSNITIHFLIKGELTNSSTSFEEKMRKLFHSEDDLSVLSELISDIDTPYRFAFGPFVQISKETEPLLHAFQITILFDKP